MSRRSGRAPRAAAGGGARSRHPGWGLRLGQPPNTVDDAYITFRHTQHLLDGDGLTYNAGVAVLGTTSPAYALLLALAALLSGTRDLPVLALHLNALLDGAAVVVVALLTRRLARFADLTYTTAPALLAAGLYAVSGRSVDFSTGGMETPLFMLILLVVVWLLAAGRPVAAAGAAGMSVIVRPDGLLLVPALLVAVALTDRKRLTRASIAATAPVLVALGTAALVFGDPLPASLRAKAAGIYALPADHALRYLLRHLAGLAWPRVQLGRLAPFLPGAARDYLTLLASMLLPVTLMVFAGRALRPARAMLLFVGLYTGLFWVAFAAGNPFMMGWYYMPLELLYFLLFSLGLGWLAGRLGPIPGPAIAVLLAALLLAPQAARYDLAGAGASPLRIRSEWEKVRESDYRRVGADLMALTGGRATVASPEIGALGHAYSGAILDTAGLVSPEARAYYPLPRELVALNQAVPPDLIADRQPEIVVFLEVFGRKGLLRDPRFARDYRLWRVYPSRTFGSKGLLVYVRADLPWTRGGPGSPRGPA